MKFPIKLIEDFGGYQKDDIIFVDYEIQEYLFDNGLCEEVEDDEIDEFIMNDSEDFKEVNNPIDDFEMSIEEIKFELKNEVSENE